MKPDRTIIHRLGRDRLVRPEHDFCLQAAGSPQREFGVLVHSPEAITLWAKALYRRFGGPIAVCLEIAKGPLVHALQRHEFIVLFPVNPATLAKYREAFVPSRAKDDPTDAQIALELLLRHRDKLQPLQPQSADMRTLATLVEQRRLLVGDKTRITNRLGSTLKEYFPQALDWFEDRDTVLFCDFLQRWPSLKHAKRARQATLRAFFAAHNLRRASLIEERIHGIRSATALTDDVAVMGPHQLLVQALVAQLRVTLQAIDHFDAEITAVAKRLPDYALFAALPGAGSILAPRFSSPSVSNVSATPVPPTSNSTRVSHPYWSAAATSVGPLATGLSNLPASDLRRMGGKHDPALVLGQRLLPSPTRQGMLHQAAVRALAYKWIRILYRCWQTRTPYDESVYLLALKHRGSPLIAAMATTPQNT